jgi:hypothetical protein
MLSSQTPALRSSWGSCRPKLFIPEVIAVLSSTLRCRSRLPCFSHVLRPLPPRSFGPHFPSRCVPKFVLSGPALWFARSSLALVQSYLTTPLLHNGSSSCLRRPIYSTVHNFPGS